MTTKIEKPVVHFIGEPHYWMWDAKNEVAGLLFVLDHPWLGACPDVRTSTVLKKFPDGSFETRNTMYIPATEEMKNEFYSKVQEATKELSYSQTGLAGS